jgi:hypothetical protein
MSLFFENFPLRSLTLGVMALPIVLSALSLPAFALAPWALTFRGAPVRVLLIPAGARVKPIASNPGRTVLAWAKKTGALAAINGGYFNHSDGAPVSHVIVDGLSVTRPEDNLALTRNPVLKPLLPAIFYSRVAWRAFQNPQGNVVWDLAPFKAPTPLGDRLLQALQAGPRLLPSRNLPAEGFQLLGAHGVVLRDGIASASRVPRSALGLLSDGRMLWVAVGGRGVTIQGLAALMRSLHANAAMALDGGSSTTLSWRSGDRWQTFVGQGGAPARVNSALVLLP